MGARRRYAEPSLRTMLRQGDKRTFGREAVDAENKRGNAAQRSHRGGAERRPMAVLVSSSRDAAAAAAAIGSSPGRMLAWARPALD